MLADAHAGPPHLVAARKLKGVDVSVRARRRLADDGAQVIVPNDAHDALGVADGPRPGQKRHVAGNLWFFGGERPPPGRVVADNLLLIGVNELWFLEPGRSERVAGQVGQKLERTAGWVPPKIEDNPVCVCKLPDVLPERRPHGPSEINVANAGAERIYCVRTIIHPKLSPGDAPVGTRHLARVLGVPSPNGERDRRSQVSPTQLLQGPPLRPLRRAGDIPLPFLQLLLGRTTTDRHDHVSDVRTQSPIEVPRGVYDDDLVPDPTKPDGQSGGGRRS